jgi:NADH-quinone oxidoreductase subunit J
MNLLIFYIFSFLLLIAAFAVILARNPIYSVLWLIFSFFCAAGIFILQGAEFLAMLLVIVYVGAVATLFLFVIMMLNIDYQAIKKDWLKILPFSIAFLSVFILNIYLAVIDITILQPDLANNFIIPEQVTNTHALGYILYTDFILHFQLAAIILLLAMIGAVVLTHYKLSKAKKQSVREQIMRNKASGVKLVKVLTGKGI